MEKLRNLKPKEATQKTMICTWLTEMFLNKLTMLSDKDKEEQYAEVQNEFSGILSGKH